MRIKYTIVFIFLVISMASVFGQEVEKIESGKKKVSLEEKQRVESGIILENRTEGVGIRSEEAVNEPNSGIVITEPLIEISNHQTVGIDDSIPHVRYLKGIPFGYQTDTGMTLRAAPVNDLICNALNLDLVGGCITGETTHEANADYFGGCVLNGSPSVFYEFTITGTNNMVTIDMDNFADVGRQLYLYLFEGPCTAPTGIATECTVTPAGAISFDFFNLTPGVNYFLMVAGQPGVGNELTSFDICATQAIAPPLITGPEQDCFGAIPVCDHTYVQNLSYTGYWDNQELITGATCLYGGENNSVWYVFTPQTDGDLAFMIQTTKDYDWALYDLTAIGGCSNVPSSTPVLCNYSGTLGNTGCTLPVNATIPREEGAAGVPTMAGIPVLAGNTYALLIDNYTADINGYTLSFDISAGTASIADNPPATGAYPSMTSAANSCTGNTITINLSEYVDCYTIGQSDFSLTNTTTSTDFTSAIVSVTGASCSTSDYTNQLIITHDGSLTTGSYTITVNASPALADICGNHIEAGGNVSFQFLAPISLTTSDANICGGESINLNADGADGTPSVITYTLNPGGLTNNTDGVFSGLTPAITTTYNVSTSYGGCSSSATVVVNVEGNILTSIDPTNKTVCSFPVTLTATTNINGTPCVGCTYVWSTTETTSAISVGASGTYTVSATTPNGCTNFNSPQSIISEAGSGTGGGTCDVIYVSPAGGGTGLTKDSPTTLALAVDLAVCTNTTIKMMKGVYTLTDYQYVPSFITIEGGYDATFENKYSDLSGGSNSTTIRRSATADTGFPTHCSAFRVEDGAEEFRIQDIRIEMPGSAFVAGHAASSNMINYGIRLGTTCSNYNIVRCYIDAGVGAAP